MFAKFGMIYKIRNTNSVNKMQTCKFGLNELFSQYQIFNIRRCIVKIKLSTSLHQRFYNVLQLIHLFFVLLNDSLVLLRTLPFFPP